MPAAEALVLHTLLEVAGSEQEYEDSKKNKTPTTQ